MTVTDYILARLDWYYPIQDVNIAIGDYRGMDGEDIPDMELTPYLAQYAEECIRASTWDMEPPAMPFYRGKIGIPYTYMLTE